MKTFRYITRAIFSLSVTIFTACGGGASTSGDAADKYTGTWRSVCAPSINNGQIYYTYRVRVLTKLSANELASANTAESAYSDAACRQLSDVQVLGRNPSKISIGSRVTFLGQTVDALTETDTVENITVPGYGTADSKQMYFVYELDGKKPTGWSENSPYTKQ
jgi:hypothetical protein